MWTLFPIIRACLDTQEHWLIPMERCLLRVADLRTTTLDSAAAVRLGSSAARRRSRAALYQIIRQRTLVGRSESPAVQWRFCKAPFPETQPSAAGAESSMRVPQGCWFKTPRSRETVRDFQAVVSLMVVRSRSATPPLLAIPMIIAAVFTVKTSRLSN